jgi:hypothetical protein
MKTPSVLRAACHSRAIVRSVPGDPVGEVRLSRALVVTHLVLLALCAARVGTDLRRGPLSIEGDIALAIFVILAISTLARAIGWAMRRAVPTDKGMTSTGFDPHDGRNARP